MTYKEKLLDPRWQKKRLEVLSADDFTCRWCGKTEDTLHVHHFHYNKNGNPWDVPNDALITLCKKCHAVSHINRLPDYLGNALTFFHTDLKKYGESVQVINDYILEYFKINV